MKTACVLSLIAMGIASLAGCNENEEMIAPKASPQGYPFEIPAWDYSTNHFFVDTTYRQFYEPYYQSNPPNVHSATQVVEEEMWIQQPNGFPGSPGRHGIAFISLPPRPEQGYDSTLRSMTEVPGEIEVGSFQRITRPEYEMTGDGYLGVVFFKRGFFDQRVIGISYQRFDGAQYGDFSWQATDSSSPLILKMVKPRNLLSNGPAYRVAWNQLLKNIYAIGVGGGSLSEVGFNLDIVYGPTPSGSANSILGHPLLRVLGLDRYNFDGTFAPNGDGVFDFRPGATIDPAEGEIILPYLRPFDGGIKEYFIANSLPFPDSAYLAPGIYDTTRTFAALASPYFKLSGRAQFH